MVTRFAALTRTLKLHTRCPNLGEFWPGGDTSTATVTIMILGLPPDPNEPENTAEATASWWLDYVMITSLDRDDMADQGSGHFAEMMIKLKKLKPNMLIEAL